MRANGDLAISQPGRLCLVGSVFLRRHPTLPLGVQGVNLNVWLVFRNRHDVFPPVL